MCSSGLMSWRGREREKGGGKDVNEEATGASN